jgi:protoporphyrinogen oxidase
MTRIAIVGGGPGGLMTARLLERTLGSSCRLTLLEASHRVGGKIQTRRFDTAPVLYESGVAECYAYDPLDHHPLRQLITELSGLLSSSVPLELAWASRRDTLTTLGTAS